MLLKDVSHATDLDLLTVLLGDRKTATKLLANAKFSLFSLLHSLPHANVDLFRADHAIANAETSLASVGALATARRDCDGGDR